MIVFLAGGKLGNQIFQYVFLKNMKRNNEKLIIYGFEDLLKVFDINDVINLNKKYRWFRLLFKFFEPILNFLSYIKIISSIAVNHEKILSKYEREDITFNSKIGLIKNITFLKIGFFQSEIFVNKETAKKLKIKNMFLKKACKFLEIIPKHYHKIFIHIRQGDYKDFKIYGKSTLLPINYYKERIKWFLKNREDCFFIFLSDEPEFIEKEFKTVKNKIISIKNHFGTDIAIMTLCNSAILSPSSFGWWGSYLMKDRDTVFAPKYWLGFNSKIDFHKKPLAHYMRNIL